MPQSLNCRFYFVYVLSALTAAAGGFKYDFRCVVYHGAKVGDIVFVWLNLPAYMRTSQGISTQVTVTSIREEVQGVRTLTISREDGGVFHYSPGQFITLIFRHTGKEERRSYSISWLPEDAHSLSFTVKRIENGACSRWLTDRVQIGDKLEVTEVAGFFVLPEQAEGYKQVILFAAGIGITPMVPMIQWLLANEKSVFVTLVYSNTEKSSTIFLESLEDLLRQYPDRLTIEFLYSNSFNLMRARLNKELTVVLLNEYLRFSVGNTLYYVCGPSDYMRMVTYALEEYGVERARIIKERFNTDKVGVKNPAPEDTAKHTVTMVRKGVTHSFAVTYPETILSAAKREGIALPYSCETGICGSCAAVCIRGKVWHSYNEVLTDKELQTGRILTCIATPVDGDVEISV